MSSSRAQAQSEPLQQELQVRIGASVKKEVVDDLDVSLSPEMRTDGFNPDRYLLELGLRYKPIKYFAVKGAFRGDMREKNSGPDYGYRPAIAVSGFLPFLDDFEAEARVQYLHGFGPDRPTEQTLRYKAGLGWEVPKTDLDLSAWVEPFQNLPDGVFVRMRYGVEGKYKFYGSKKFDQWISLGYMFDYYLTERRNRHIPMIQYSCAF